MKTQIEVENNTEAELHWKEFSVIQNMNLDKMSKLFDSSIGLESNLDNIM
jgi:hypothetical protein